MSPDEIEAELRADSAWQRPTWPLGQLGHHSRMDEALETELHAFAFGQRPKTASQANAPPELREALSALELGWPVTLDEVKTRYKELAKRHHPDANHGDKRSEERLKVHQPCLCDASWQTVREPGAYRRDRGGLALVEPLPEAAHVYVRTKD